MLRIAPTTVAGLVGLPLNAIGAQSGLATDKK